MGAVGARGPCNPSGQGDFFQGHTAEGELEVSSLPLRLRARLASQASLHKVSQVPHKGQSEHLIKCRFQGHPSFLLARNLHFQQIYSPCTPCSRGDEVQPALPWEASTAVWTGGHGAGLQPASS